MIKISEGWQVVHFPFQFCYNEYALSSEMFSAIMFNKFL
jgi:hypothetical protein